MGVMDNILSKMQATPEFRPMSADTFSDWSIEAGDILTVEVDGKDEFLPVFSSDLDWGGAAKSTLSCSGSRERPTLSKQERQSYAAFGGMASEIKKAKDDILEDRNELIAALNGEDGAPEDLLSGLENYVRYDLKNNEGYAESTLFSQIGEKAQSEIRTYVYVDADGEKHALVDVIAKVDDAESGLATKVGTKDLRETLKNYALADSLAEYLKVTKAAELYVTDSGVKSIIGAYIVTDASGNQSTLAAILADVIKLQGDTEILGNLSIVNGRLNVSRSLQASSIFASGLTIDASTKYPIRVGSGYLGASTTAYFESDGITLGSTKYSPQGITSTDGTLHTVLGSA